MQAVLFSAERVAKPGTSENGYHRSRNASPALSASNLDVNQFSYVSFPQATAPPPPRSHPAQPALGIDHAKGLPSDSRVPKTLLGRFKSAIGASTWIFPATTSEHKTSTTAFSTHPSPPRGPIAHPHIEIEIPKSSSLRMSHAKKHQSGHNADRLLGGGTAHAHWGQVEWIGSSGSNPPSLQSSPSPNWMHPGQTSTSAAAQPRVMDSHQQTMPRATVGLGIPYHPNRVASSGSPTRRRNSRSFKVPNQLITDSYQMHRPFPATPDSSQTPFHFNSQSEFDGPLPSTSSDAILRSLGLSHAGNNHSPEYPIVPAFSHIPGFPLGRETVGDDNGSVFSSSVGASTAPKFSRINRDEYQSPRRDYPGSMQVIGGIQGKGLSKEYWMPDKDAKECYDCAVAFTSWRRKHHCRICGAIFCSRCASNLVPGHRFASSGYIRVCNICQAKLEPESDEPANYAAREDTDDDQSFSEVTSGLHKSGSRSQVNRGSIAISSKQRDGNRSFGEQLASSFGQHTDRSHFRNQSEHLVFQNKNRTRRLSAADRIMSRLSIRRDSSPRRHAYPAKVESSSTSNGKNATQSNTSAPFRKGLTDEEQSGLPDMKALSDSQSVLISSSTASNPATDITHTRSDRGDHHAESLPASTEAFSESNKNDETDTGSLFATLRLTKPAHSEAPNDRCLTSSLKLSKPSSIGLLSETEQGLDNSIADLSASSCKHIRSMIRQFLIRENIPKAPVWEAELTTLLLQLVADPPRPAHDGEDAADIRKLIKIKKIPGGKPGDSEFVHGIVFTKNIAHKKMNKYCVNPRVLTISIPLEFQRVDGYTKLESLVRQERQYLKTLVHRLTSLKPDLLLVEGSVSGLAIEYLTRANVTVMRNVKPAVLKAVARTTQTPLISSLDKLLNLKVGQCDLFHVQTLQHRLIPGNKTKTLTRLEGCEPSLGGTIVLRGGDLATLSKVKALMSMMVRIVYSLRLEKAFLNDEGAVYSNDPSKDASLHDSDSTDIRCILSRFRRARRLLNNTLPLAKLKSPPLGSPDPPATQSEPMPLSEQIADLLKPYEIILLSGTPRVNLQPPFVLVKLHKLNCQLCDLRQSIETTQTSTNNLHLLEEKQDDSVHSQCDKTPSSNLSTSTDSFDGSYQSSKSAETSARPPPSAKTEEYARNELLAELSRQLDAERCAAHFYLSTHRTETFSAADHQRIVVQETVTCSSSAGASGYTCQGPHLRAFSFYSAGDQSVGEIIQMLVACQSEICPHKGCNQPKRLHQTNWIHDNFKATVQIHPPEAASPSASISTGTTTVGADDSRPYSEYQADSEDQNLIMMQGYCPFCDGYTRKIHMSDDAWRLSLGKYLQLCFYTPGLVSDFVFHTSSGLELKCNHDCHVDHVRMFFYQGFHIHFRLQKVTVYEAIPPSLILVTPSKAQAKVREEEYDTISKRSETFFHSVKNRIIGFNYDIVGNEKLDASEEAMRELLKKVDLDVQAVQSQLDEVYNNCLGTNGVRMNIVRKTLIDKAVEWDQLFATFELRFIAGDNKDARRLTSVQLKKIFTDQAGMAGSPDRLFPRLNQLPTLSYPKYNYNSQSEVDSDHAPKGQVSDTIKKAFPSPTLKSVASALAFALPSSMPGLGIADTRQELPAEKHKSALSRQVGQRLGMLHSSEPPTPREEQMSDFNLYISTPTAEFSTSSQIPLERSIGPPIPSVVVEPASTPSSSLRNPSRLAEVPERIADGMSKNVGKSPLTEMFSSAAASTSLTNPVEEALPLEPLLKPSPHPVEGPVLESDGDVHAGAVVTQEEDSKSDSTVVNVRTSGNDTSQSKGPDCRPKNPAESDTDTTTTSEADLRCDPRRLTLRGRRVKDLGLNSRGGVANLVQKFESPTAAERKQLTANSSALLEALSRPTKLEVETPSKPLKSSSLVVRPSFRRGKSEIVRSSSSGLRGKRPITALEKASVHDSRTPAGPSLSQQREPSKPSIDTTSHTGSKTASRNQLRVVNRLAPAKILSEPPHFYRIPISRPGPHGSELLIEKSRTNAALPRAPRLNKDVPSRRNRPESGLPVSSSYIHRRGNMPSTSKVATIARHFDRMNRDVERERLKQASDHRSRPRPIAHAKSSVQAFSSLTAAVNEDSDSDADECEGHPAGHDADDEGDVIPEAYGPETSEQGGLKPEESPSTGPLPLGADATPSAPHPSPDLERANINQLAGSSQAICALSPNRTTPCSPSFLGESFRLPPSGVSQFSDNDMSSSDTGRHSIIKTLSSLWSYRGAEFLPLEYPQLPTEHQSAENPVIIREDEPSSIIAYTLASKLYQDTLKETEPRVVERSEIFMPEEFKNRAGDIDSTWGMIDFIPEEIEVDDVFKVPMNNAKSMQFRYDVAPCTITCKVFFMHQFDALRKTLLCRDIVESLARCHKWDASGGKSGQKFLKTKDGRYLIKGISKTELEALTKFAPAYFEYLSSARKEKRPITLAKMLGIFQVSFSNKITNRKGRLQVQVIENLWFTKPHLQIYDLKGLTRNRTVHATGRPHEVLLDGNFCEMLRTNPVLVHENSLLRLQAGLHNDTLFLANNNVMDYSLAIGFDDERQELCVGIIDYLQTYSWDKRLETLVKELGGTSKEAPTIITPSLYKARFRRAMARYFTVAPDAWLHKWKPYLFPSEDDSAATGLERDGSKATETNVKAEDSYIHFSSP